MLSDIESGKKASGQNHIPGTGDCANCREINSITRIYSIISFNKIMSEDPDQSCLHSVKNHASKLKYKINSTILPSPLKNQENLKCKYNFRAKRQQSEVSISM